MMDESISYPDVEVYWDCDSPTASAWRNLQAPKRGNDELHSSPQLARTKKRATTRTVNLLNDRPGSEQSRKEVFQIINALRRVSREGFENGSESSHGRKLVVPESGIPEEEESEDEERFSTVPMFKSSAQTNTNTSIDLLFDMSGNGEDIAPTATKSTGNTAKAHSPVGNKSKVVPKAVSPQGADVWTDDDLFSDDVLMSEMEKIPNAATPARMHNKPLNASTPLNSKAEGSAKPGAKSREIVNASAKGFLDFFMDSEKPAKPSPEKHKSLVTKANNYKFSKKENTNRATTSACNKNNQNGTIHDERTAANLGCHKLLVHDQPSVSKFGNGQDMPKYGKVAPKKDIAMTSTVKPMDTSIPLDVLEELIMEDSWTEGEEATPQKPKTADSYKKQKTFSKQQPMTTGLHCAKPFSSEATKPQRSSNNKQMKGGPGLKRSHTVPFQGKRDAAHRNSGQFRKEARKIVQSNPTKSRADVDTDGFSSDDEEFLLEAVALSESQQSSEGLDIRTGKTSVPVSRPSSQPKYSRLEIEMKKRMAMERRMKSIKNKQSSGT